MTVNRYFVSFTMYL